MNLLKYRKTISKQHNLQYENQRNNNNLLYETYVSQETLHKSGKVPGRILNKTTYKVHVNFYTHKTPTTHVIRYYNYYDSNNYYNKFRRYINN